MTIRRRNVSSMKIFLIEIEEIMERRRSSLLRYLHWSERAKSQKIKIIIILVVIFVFIVTAVICLAFICVFRNNNERRNQTIEKCKDISS